MTERMFQDEECLPQYFNEEPVTKKKVVVPEGMLTAAEDSIGWPHSLRRADSRLGIAIEKALLWLSENPIVPTENQYDACLVSYEDAGKTGYECAVLFISEWQRRMFAAPEPEVPEEIKDLEVNDLDLGWDGPVNRRILEAFRRGQKSGTK